MLFTLYFKGDVNPDGSIKEGVEGGKPLGDLPKVDHEHDHEEERKKYEEAKKGEGKMDGNNGVNGVGEANKPVVETSADDVD